MFRPETPFPRHYWTTFLGVLAALAVGFLLGEIDYLDIPSSDRVLPTLEALDERERNRVDGFERYPYIQGTTHESFRVCWKFPRSSTATLAYGPALNDLRHRLNSETPAEKHSLAVENLPPSRVTYYQILDAEGRALTPVEHTETFPAPGTAHDFSFAVLGDSGEPFSMLGQVAAGPSQLAIAEQIERLYPDFVIHTGDVVYQEGEWENWTPLFFEPYHFILRRAPFFPCLGNHDIHTELGEPWLDSFHLPENNDLFPERYYSFDCGNAHFTVLDSSIYDQYQEDPEVEIPAETLLRQRVHQTEWLEADLRAVPEGRWKFVVFHHPMHTTGAPTDREDRGREEMIADWRGVFERHRVDFVLCGHEHLYERFHPLAAGKLDATEGVVYIVTGGGGGDLDRFHTPKPEEMAARAEGFFHFVHFRMEGDSALVRAIDTAGETLDSAVYSRGRNLTASLEGHRGE